MLYNNRILNPCLVKQFNVFPANILNTLLFFNQLNRTIHHLDVEEDKKY